MLSDSEWRELEAAKHEALVVLAEECAEVVKAVTKLLRHGSQACDPTAPQRGTNLDMLRKELGDVIGAIRLCETQGISLGWHDKTINNRAAEKLRRMRPYLHHAIVEETPADA